MSRFVVYSLTCLFFFLASPVHAATTYYVSTGGSDSNPGTSAALSFVTIQKGFDVAQPGDTIQLEPGTYLQDAISKRDGTQASPITIMGTPQAIVKGAGGARIFEINHDHIIFKNFTIDGHHTSSDTATSYRDKLIYIQGKQIRSGVTGLKVLNMTLRNAGGECLRLRYFATDNEVANSTIQNCGVIDFRFSGGGKNGEGVYIGTSNTQWGDGKNPTNEPDVSTGNWIHHNTFDTQGNECVDIKEGATGNIIEHNTCSGQKDPESGGFDSRGNGNTFRFNISRNNTGAGIRFGGANATYGINNDAYGNTITGNAAGGIKFMASPQRIICGNTMSGNTGGNSVGSFASSFNPANPCAPGTGTPPITAPTATPTSPITPTATPIITDVPTDTPAAPTASPTPPPGCPKRNLGDATCDGLIKLGDYDRWRREFYGELTTLEADFNGDGTISISDHSIWRQSFFDSQPQ